jgi:RNA polymerase sigma factor for flagellar operon FliA
VSKTATGERTLDTTWTRFLAERDTKDRDALVLRYMGLVRYIVNRTAASLPPSVARDDLMSVGTMGLITAVDRFDASRGVAFETFARPRIYGALLDELRSQDWLPRSLRQKAKKVDAAYQRLQVRKGSQVSEVEVAEELEISVHEVRLLVSQVLGMSFQSLDSAVSEGGENKEIRLIDTIEDHRGRNPNHELASRQLSEILIDTIKNLPRQERLVIILYYYERLTLKEIGAILHLSESRISQIHSKAVTKLRGRLRSVREDHRLLAHERHNGPVLVHC